MVRQRSDTWSGQTARHPRAATLPRQTSRERELSSRGARGPPSANAAPSSAAAAIRATAEREHVGIDVGRLAVEAGLEADGLARLLVRGGRTTV